MESKFKEIAKMFDVAVGQTFNIKFATGSGDWNPVEKNIRYKFATDGLFCTEYAEDGSPVKTSKSSFVLSKLLDGSAAVDRTSLSLWTPTTYDECWVYRGSRKDAVSTVFDPGAVYDLALFHCGLIFADERDAKTIGVERVKRLRKAYEEGRIINREELLK